MRGKSLLVLGAVGALAVAGCSGDDDDAEASGDLQALCSQMAEIEGPQDITVERLDQLLEVAVPEVEEPIRYIRDHLAEDGEAAFEDDAVGQRFEQVGAFESEECRNE